MYVYSMEDWFENIPLPCAKQICILSVLSNTEIASLDKYL